jgi:hypothetical protein
MGLEAGQTKRRTRADVHISAGRYDAADRAGLIEALAWR